jgi:hypothetical protein
MSGELLTLGDDPFAPEAQLYRLPEELDGPIDLVVDMGEPDPKLLLSWLTSIGQRAHAKPYRTLLEDDFIVVQLRAGNPPAFARELDRISLGAARVLGWLKRPPTD